MIFPRKYIVEQCFPEVKQNSDYHHNFIVDIDMYNNDGKVYSENTVSKLYIAELEANRYFTCEVKSVLYINRKNKSSLLKYRFNSYHHLYTAFDDGKQWLEEYIHNHLPFCPIDIIQECYLLK